MVKRDLPQWGVRAPAITMFRLWSMIAHMHGQIWNAAEPSRSLGLNQSTCRRYLDFLSDAMMVRQLQPWHANLSKRQVKSPKIYLRDSGILHQLLGVHSQQSLFMHPRLGASWEGFVIEQVLQVVPHEQAFFWATHQGAEIDLILLDKGRLTGIECKKKDAPGITKSIKIAMEDLQLDRLVVIYPGSKAYSLANKVEVIPLANLAQESPI